MNQVIFRPVDSSSAVVFVPEHLVDGLSICSSREIVVPSGPAQDLNLWALPVETARGTKGLIGGVHSHYFYERDTSLRSVIDHSALQFGPNGIARVLSIDKDCKILNDV